MVTAKESNERFRNLDSSEMYTSGSKSVFVVETMVFGLIFSDEKNSNLTFFSFSETGKC